MAQYACAQLQRCYGSSWMPSALLACGLQLFEILCVRSCLGVRGRGGGAAGGYLLSQSIHGRHAMNAQLLKMLSMWQAEPFEKCQFQASLPLQQGSP